MELLEARETRVGVLDKAMSILSVYSRGDLALSPLEIAARTSLPLPTVYRLAQALSEHGLLMKDGQRFRLGMTLLHLGMLVAESIDVRRQALQHLKWLNEQTEENAELHIRHGAARMVIEVVSSPHNLRPFADLGAPLPLHRGAAGKVLLAWLPGVERETLVAASRALFSDNQSFNPHQLHAELARIHAVGWAASDGERVTGVSALAAPVFDAAGHVAAALTLVAPSARLSEDKRAHYIPLVSEAARRTSHDLGYVQLDWRKK